MPGMEVFTIAGAPFGAAEAVTPAVKLQNALKALGNARGDSTLAAVGVDGAIGPKTVAAVNYALKNITGATPVRVLGGRFLNATATKLDVQNNAAALAQVFETAVRMAGGTVPPPSVAMTKRAPSFPGSIPEPMVVDPSGTHTNLAWIVGGLGVVVLALGFLAARRRAATA